MTKQKPQAVPAGPAQGPRWVDGQLQMSPAQVQRLMAPKIHELRALVDLLEQDQLPTLPAKKIANTLRPFFRQVIDPVFTIRLGMAPNLRTVSCRLKDRVLQTEQFDPYAELPEADQRLGRLCERVEAILQPVEQGAMPPQAVEQLKRVADELQAWPAVAGPATTAAVADQAGGVGKGMSWEVAKQKAEAYCKHHPFPGGRALAIEVGCSPATIRKAIEKSVILKARRRQQKERTPAKPREKGLSVVDLATIAQTREPASDMPEEELVDLIAEQGKELAREDRQHQAAKRTRGPAR